MVVAFSILPPWKIINEEKFEGVYAELIRELAQELKMKVEFRECPLKRCLKMIEHGDADIIIGIKDVSARKQYIEFLKTPSK